MKVRVRSKYVYNPNLLDLIDARTEATSGSIVRVVNLPNTPKANTFGHCYIETLEGTFLGLVSINSLTPIPKKAK